MMKYTREDVIVTREQVEKAGLKEGMTVYWGNTPTECIKNANKDINGTELQAINWSFSVPFCEQEFLGSWWECVILKKEPEKKLVPFDFSLKEDRDALMGKVIKKESKIPYYEWETMVTTFNVHGYHEDWCVVADNGLLQISAKELLDDWTFSDTGKPVGKEIEV